MNQVGVNRQYNDLIGKYKDVPFSQEYRLRCEPVCH